MHADTVPGLIRTNVITGFLGTGKTTAIRHLLTCKPASERWAVLVNEFGEIGIDGALLDGRGATVREVPGGCMCCAAGLPTRVALNQLLRSSQPDRLLIEPTGLGHPAQILEMLHEDHYRDVLDLRAVITLVDPRHLEQPRYREHSTFQQQVAIADVLVASKMDQCTPAQYRNFLDWATPRLRPEVQVTSISDGRIDPGWLQPAAGTRPGHRHPVHAHPEPAGTSPGAPQPDTGQGYSRHVRSGDGHVVCGWLFNPALTFRFDRLLSLLSAVDAQRLKAVMITDRGVHAFNAEGGVLTILEQDDCLDSRIEIIHPENLDWDGIERALLATLEGQSTPVRPD